MKRKKLFNAAVKIASGLMGSNLYTMIINSANEPSSVADVVAKISVKYAKAIDTEVDKEKKK